ncbi:MAG: type II glyceraldehyde-3-phosphate dehydrogenase [Candidatus Aenigmarchaeota archaeon]|nr:type II glyceraldehyde-3-phosphate dehydrogenase [Candidatus Aenigmarchaeota archaeon]
MISVCVNGYGTIGKRVADALGRHPEIKLVGVSKFTPDADARIASSKGIRIFVPKENHDAFVKFGIQPAGDTEEMIDVSEIIIDASPDKKGIKNKEEIYVPKGKRAIFQGGEKENVAEVSFNARSNFNAAKNKNYVRVVSCNTTGLCRIIKPMLENRDDLERISVSLIRRGSDPNDSKGSALNSVEWESNSHHAHDVQTVLGSLPITTTAFKAPQTLMHVHSISMRFKDAAPSKQDVENIYAKESRVALLRTASSTADIIEKARDLGFSRNDIFLVNLHSNTIVSDKNELSMAITVPQESIVTPEDVDAAVSMSGLMNQENSMELTNKIMGLGNIKSKLEAAFG